MDNDFQSGYDSEYPAIHDVTSRELSNLVLLYGTSTLGVYRALGFHVTRTQRRTQYVPNEPTISASSTLGFGYLGENGHSQATGVTDPGDDVLAIEERMPSTIIEYGIAVEPNDLYVGIENPTGAPLLGINPQSDRGRQYDETVLDQYGSVQSDYTSIESPDGTEPIPTTALSNKREQGIVRIDSRQNGENRIRLAFKNTTNGDITPDITAIGRTYRVDPITDPATVKNLLRDDTTRVLSYGGFENTNPNLPPDWQSATVRLDAGELAPGPSN